MDNNDEAKRLKKNQAKRDRYKLSSKCKNNILSMSTSEDDSDGHADVGEPKLKKKKRTRKSTTKPHPTLNRESAASQIRSQPLAEKASSQAAVSTTSSLLATNKLMADRAIEQQVMDVLAAKELINLGQSSHHQPSSSYELPPASPPSQNQDEGLPIYSFSRPADLYDSLDDEEETRRLLLEMSHQQKNFKEKITEAYENESEWQKRIQTRKGNWDSSRESFFLKAVLSDSPSFEFCSRCVIPVTSSEIYCGTCKQDLCFMCDEHVHSSDPFHARTMYIREGFVANKLLPTEFVEPVSCRVKTKVIPVPCRVPKCPSCETPTLSLSAGDKLKFAVTLEGRFDLHSSVLKCSACPYYYELEEQDYIASKWWPGATSGSRYLFSEELLDHWFHLSHQFRGPSTNKFVATLNRKSSKAQRNETIDIPLFNKASREYQFYLHRMNTEIRLQTPTLCPACGEPDDITDDSLETENGVKILKRHACVDGNMKVPRLASASEGDGQSLLKGVLFASDEAVNNHLSGANVNQGSNTTPCGSNVFTAAKEKSKSKKNYKETGVVLACCRHLMILSCVNIFVGEAYKFAHYLHNQLFEKGYQVFCYDIVCMYWTWAEKIGKKFPEFDPLTKKMMPFLPRWHGIAHVWHCYIRHVGHYKEGVGGTVGEEMEQVNADFSLYGNKTKHMTSENRIDELTQGGLYMNIERIRKMPDFLASRMKKALIYVDAYALKLKHLLQSFNRKEEELPSIFADLIRMAEDCADKNIDGEGPPSYLLTDLEATFFEYQRAQTQIDEAVYAIPRTRAVRLRNAAKKKADKLIRKLNDWHVKCRKEEEPNISEGDEEINDYITMDDFLKGLFPWQLSGDKDDFKSKRNLTETWMLSQRYKEEVILIASEMNTFVRSLDSTIHSLRQQLAEPLSEPISSFALAKRFIKFQEASRLSKARCDAMYLFRKIDEISCESEVDESDFEENI